MGGTFKERSIHPSHCFGKEKLAARDVDPLAVRVRASGVKLLGALSFFRASYPFFKAFLKGSYPF